MKNGLTNDKVLAHWARDLPTKLRINRGLEVIAAAIYQKNPDTGNWHSINYASRVLTPTEQQYAVTARIAFLLYDIIANRMYLYVSLQWSQITNHCFPCTTTLNVPTSLSGTQEKRQENQSITMVGTHWKEK